MFELPISTIVNRTIPKNSFEAFTNPRQKKCLKDVINKIKWLNKISSLTINLEGKETKEIQLIEISLKQKDSITEIINVIDRVIPYNIIFIIRFEEEFRLSASQKHIHPTNENQAVIDWSFSSDWHSIEKFPYKLNLQQNLDFVFYDICFQISGSRSKSKLNIKDLIVEDQQKKQLFEQIHKLESAIKSSKQFNKKVELNLQLLQCKKELQAINQGNKA